jgi:hypothetical protein
MIYPDMTTVSDEEAEVEERVKLMLDLCHS